ncbi:MAG: VOC family protein [Chloroflexi bacterium]|nr:VOC family protein [Chloroflexota bacterium]MYK60909.1 VOC family protein [Chloroflexota bacterium]
MSLTIYLHFNGNCREAFEFYRSIFGGEFEMISTFREGPEGMPLPEDVLDQVMHVSYPIGSSMLMGSDVPEQFAPPPVQGSNFSISYQPESKAAADELFAKLSDGGTVTMPMEDQFWGAYFGSCIDKFGISWQLNTEH